MVAPAPSKETQDEAMKIASATKKPGQTKEQTRLIAQGIEKGIALYKKQQKAKARERDKERKKLIKQKAAENDGAMVGEQVINEANVRSSSVRDSSTSLTPWILLGLSWAGFAYYLFWNNAI